MSAGGTSFLVSRDPSTPDVLELVKSGSFTPDANGFLTDVAGRQLLGFPTDTSGTVTAPGQNPSDLQPVRLPTGTASQPTTQANLAATLPAGAAVGDQFQASLTVIDSLGTEQVLNANFTKTGVNAFSVGFAVDPTQGSITSPAGPVGLTFDGSGALTSIAGIGSPGAPANIALSLDFTASGGTAQSVTFGLGSFGGNALNQIAAPFSITSANADGTAPSAITGFDIQSDGLVRATSANGASVAIFQVPSANVPAPTRLASDGGSFTTTAESGGIVLGGPGQAGFGGIDNGLSRSNVDLATEISNLTLASSAYKAAIKVAQTGDELLDSIIDIKR